MPDFMSDLAVRLVDSAYQFHPDNHDALRFPESPDGFDAGQPGVSRDALVKAASAGFIHKTAEQRAAAVEMIGWVREIAGPLNFTYNLLGDEHSRQTLIDVMA